MTSYTKSMFDDIRSSLESGKNSSGNFRDIFKTEIGNTYLARLIPNVKEPKRTFYHYFHHVWQSPETGQYVSAICPSTWGERCPICEARFKLYKAGDEETAKLLKKKENWLVNVYVIDDPKNSDNNGTVKIFRYGKQIQKIIDEAMIGEDAEEFGPAIFDLSKNGCNLRIKVEANEGGYPTYVSSKFLIKKAIPGMTDEKIEEVLEQVFDLDSFFEIKSNDQLIEIVNENTTLKIESATKEKQEEQVTVPVEEKKLTKKTSKKKEVPEVPEDDPSDSDDSDDPSDSDDSDDSSVSDDSDDENIDDKINDLLAGL